MSIYFVLIRVASPQENEVYNKLTKISEIIELHHLFGEYEIMAKLKTDDPKGVEDNIVQKIRSIQGVIDTKTITGG